MTHNNYDNNNRIDFYVLSLINVTYFNIFCVYNDPCHLSHEMHQCLDALVLAVQEDAPSVLAMKR